MSRPRTRSTSTLSWSSSRRNSEWPTSSSRRRDSTLAGSPVHVDDQQISVASQHGGAAPSGVRGRGTTAGPGSGARPSPLGVCIPTRPRRPEQPRDSPEVLPSDAMPGESPHIARRRTGTVAKDEHGECWILKRAEARTAPSPQMAAVPCPGGHSIRPSRSTPRHCARPMPSAPGPESGPSPHLLPAPSWARTATSATTCFVEGGARLGDRVTVKNASLILGRCRDRRRRVHRSPVTFTNDLRPRIGFAVAAGALRATTVAIGCHPLGPTSPVVSGVTVGRYAMAGAGTVISRDVPDHVLVVGVPGRAVGWGVRLRALVGATTSPARAVAASRSSTTAGSASSSARPPAAARIEVRAPPGPRRSAGGAGRGRARVRTLAGPTAGCRGPARPSR